MRRFNWRTAIATRCARRSTGMRPTSSRCRAAIDYNKDDYSNSVYGLKSAENWALNLEGSYAVNAELSAQAFYTHENIKSQSAGISYGSNSASAFVGQAGNTIVSGGCFPTVLLRNQNAQDRSVPQLVHRHARQGGHVRYRVQIQEPHGRQARGRSGNSCSRYARTDIGVAGGSYANNPFALAAPAPALCGRRARCLLHPRGQHAHGHDQDDRRAARRPISRSTSRRRCACFTGTSI